MNFLDSPRRRAVLFASLYFSEGAPIGFLWLALPTQFRADGVPIAEITWLTSLLVLPWTLKFLWAPLVDWLRWPGFTIKHWILTAQALMALSVAPLLVLDMQTQFHWITASLLLHAFVAATQDVAIDALCIATTSPTERGRLNGWMQAGMLLGRASLGGGALILARYMGIHAVVCVLMGCITFSMLMVATISLDPPTGSPTKQRARELLAELKSALSVSATWKGLVFALIGGAAFKSLEVVIGPYLIDRHMTKATIGTFTAGPMIGCMVLGALIGGRLADRVPRRRLVSNALVFIAASISLLAVSDWSLSSNQQPVRLALLCLTALGIGGFTAASYALFMDLTTPAIAATQFSAFMGATNGCESWSVYTIGQLIEQWGYPPAFLCMSAASLLALPVLRSLAPTEHHREP